MVRNLYRLYLYIVFIALLIFASTSTGRLLYILLEATNLRRYGDAPVQVEIVQSWIFAVVSWLIVGALGGLHYWLIRRDIRHDPSAGISAIRSFFLNITQALCIASAVSTVGYALSSLGFFPDADVVPALSFALPTLALALLLELERRRLAVGSKAALAFRCLHLYGVQLVLLIAFVFSWYSSVKLLVGELLFGNHGIIGSCIAGGNEYCPSYQPLFLIGGLLWALAWLVVYGWVIRKDDSRVLRLILHGLSLALGIANILGGVYVIVELLLSPLFGKAVTLKDVFDFSSQFDFYTPLTLGLLIAGIYHQWLRLAMLRGLLDRVTVYLTECAIGAALTAAAFWWGCGNLLYNVLQVLFPVGPGPDAQEWIATIAILLIGLGYVPLSLYLHHRHVTDHTSAPGPRRALVLALLGSGILSLAIGGVTALYAWMTSLFSSPIQQWPQVVHYGIAAFVVGIFLVGIYLRAAVGEQLFNGKKALPTQSAPVVSTSPEQADSEPVVPSVLSADESGIEAILDQLLAGSISREEAASRIRALVAAPVSTNH